MRKMLSVMMAAAIAGSLLAGCSSSTTETTAAASSAEETTTAAEETTTEAASESAAENTGDETVVRVGGLKGPTTMGLVKLMDEAANGESENSYEFTMVTAADEMTAMVAGGKVDIALLPANVASVLYNKYLRDRYQHSRRSLLRICRQLRDNDRSVKGKDRISSGKGNYSGIRTPLCALRRRTRRGRCNS